MYIGNLEYSDWQKLSDHVTEEPKIPTRPREAWNKMVTMQIRLKECMINLLPSITSKFPNKKCYKTTNDKMSVLCVPSNTQNSLQTSFKNRRKEHVEKKRSAEMIEQWSMTVFTVISKVRYCFETQKQVCVCYRAEYKILSYCMN